MSQALRTRTEYGVEKFDCSNSEFCSLKTCLFGQDGFETNIFEGGRFDGDGIGCWQRPALNVMLKNSSSYILL